MRFNIPTDAVPALLGHQGLKIKDMQHLSNTNIKIFRLDDILSMVVIEGSENNCHLAIRMIMHSIEHLRVSQVPPSGNPALQYQDINAEDEVVALLTEIHFSKCF